MRLVRFRSAIAIFLASLSACQSTWRGHSIPSSSTASPVAGGRPVRLTLNDGRHMILSMTRVVGDSIIGNLGPESVPYATAIAEVRTIDEMSLSSNASPAATVGMGVVIVTALLGLLMLYIFNEAAGG